jgi:hypothetical protein
LAALFIPFRIGGLGIVARKEEGGAGAAGLQTCGGKRRRAGGKEPFDFVLLLVIQ